MDSADLPSVPDTLSLLLLFPSLAEIHTNIHTKKKEEAGLELICIEAQSLSLGASSKGLSWNDMSGEQSDVTPPVVVWVKDEFHIKLIRIKRADTT